MNYRQFFFVLLALTGIFVYTVAKVVPWLSVLVISVSCFTVYLWIISGAMLNRKRKELKNPQEPDYSYQPKVSIIIPAHNEEFVIEKTVAVMMNLDYPDYDVLVVDDRSQDKTGEILVQLDKKYDSRYRYHLREASATPGKSAVLNDAFQMTDGEIILVFDADAYVEPDFVKKMLPFLEPEKVGAAQARKVIRNADTNLLTKCQNYEYSMDAYFQCGRDTIKGAVELRGNGQFLKRTAVKDIGGWNESSLTDDLDISTRLHIAGWDVRFAHKICVYEEGITETAPLVRQRKRWAEGSLVRHLEYAHKLFFSQNAPFHTKMDMIAWLMQFLFPIWLIFDYGFLLWHILGWDFSKGHLISSLIVLPWMSVYFFSALIIAITRFDKPGPLEVIRGAVVTSIFLTCLWMPVSLMVMWRIVSQPTSHFDWGKTEHIGTS